MNASNKRALKEVSLEYRSRKYLLLYFFSLKIRISYSRSLVVPYIELSFQVSVDDFSLYSSLGKSSSLVCGFQVSGFFSSHMCSASLSPTCVQPVFYPCRMEQILYWFLSTVLSVTTSDDLRALYLTASEMQLFPELQSFLFQNKSN